MKLSEEMDRDKINIINKFSCTDLIGMQVARLFSSLVNDYLIKIQQLENDLKRSNDLALESINDCQESNKGKRKLEQQNSELIEALTDRLKRDCNTCEINFSTICEACKNMPGIDLIEKNKGKKWEDIIKESKDDC